MKGWRLFWACVIVLWLAGGCQVSVSPRVPLFGASPNLFLVALACLAIQSEPRSGAVIGFFAGLFEGCMAGANLAQYAISRCLVGYAVGMLARLEFDSNWVLAAIVAFLTTVASQLILMFMAPPPSVSGFLLATIGSAIYNGVLAIPLFVLLAKGAD